MTLDVAAVRAAYPALADGYAYLDGAAGTQVPGSVIDAIGDAYRSGLGNAGGVFPASIRSSRWARTASVMMSPGTIVFTLMPCLP